MVMIHVMAPQGRTREVTSSAIRLIISGCGLASGLSTLAFQRSISLQGPYLLPVRAEHSDRRVGCSPKPLVDVHLFMILSCQSSTPSTLPSSPSSHPSLYLPLPCRSDFYIQQIDTTLELRPLTLSSIRVPPRLRPDFHSIWPISFVSQRSVCAGA